MMSDKKFIKLCINIACGISPQFSERITEAQAFILRTLIHGKQKMSDLETEISWERYYQQCVITRVWRPAK